MRTLETLFLILAAVVVAALSVADRALGQEAHDHSAPPSDPSPEAAAQLAALRAEVAKYADYGAAEDDGYRRFERGAGDPLMGEHWFRRDLVVEQLDLMRPSTLIYAEIEGERRLVGVAYTVYQQPGESVPEGFAGEADRWHVHDVADLGRILVADRPVARWLLERRSVQERIGGGEGRTQLAMVHVWLIDNPDGPFANRNVALPYLRSDLPAEWAGPGGESAARGTALLLPDACASQVGALDRLARLDGGQEEALESACGTAASEVRAARDRGLEADAFNAAAGRAWVGYARALADEIRPEQARRLAAVRAATTHH